MFSFILNVGFSEAIYIAVHNAGDYDIPTSALAIGVFVFGFIVPILSIIGPTKDALSKNLRGSLDASRRNGDNEGVSQVVKKLEDLALSRREVLFSVLLIVFGIFTYYFLPYSVLSEKLGLFFFIMNVILTGVTVGFIILSMAIM